MNEAVTKTRGMEDMCWASAVPDLTIVYVIPGKQTPFNIDKVGGSIIKQRGLKDTGNLDHINNNIWGAANTTSSS